MKYYSIISDKVMPAITTWMDPKLAMLNKLSQEVKDNYQVASLICGKQIIKATNGQNTTK